MEVSAFQSIKSGLVLATGLSQDALHVYIGLGVLFAAASVTRMRIGRVVPVLAVILVAALGEVLDMRDDLHAHAAWRWRDSLHDIVNTILWPVTISLLVRTRLFRSS